MSARMLDAWQVSYSLSAPLGGALDSFREELFDSPNFDGTSGRPLLAPATCYLDLSCVLREHDAVPVGILQPRLLSPPVVDNLPLPPRDVSPLSTGPAGEGGLGGEGPIG